jgi:hypothetical protein
MARIRTIKPEFFDDPEIGDLTLWARLFFIGLWVQADREGRLLADYRRLKARIFPFDAKCPDLAKLAEELHVKGMIRRYQDSQGRECLWLPGFLKHQRPHPKEPPSIIEPCPDPQKQAEKPEAVKKHGEPCKKTASRVDYGSLDYGSGNGSGNGSLDHGSGEASAEADGAVDADGFEQFWASYPKRVGKGDARKAWRILHPPDALQSRIRDALARQRLSRQWMADGGKYIPHPSTWLNQQRWDDDVDPDVPVVGSRTVTNMAATDAWLRSHGVAS